MLLATKAASNCHQDCRALHDCILKKMSRLKTLGEYCLNLQLNPMAGLSLVC